MEYTALYYSMEQTDQIQSDVPTTIINTETFIPAAFYQQQLPELSIEHFQKFAALSFPIKGDALELTARHMWLGYLCCRGQFEEVLIFLKQITSPFVLYRYITERSNEFWFGNLLHMVLYWNTGDRAFEMYTTLRKMGAELVEDTYDHYPWESETEIWVAPTIRKVIGNRYKREFDQLYERVIQWEINYLQMKNEV
jgi:hypothetical protein